MRVEDVLQDNIIKYLTEKHVWFFRYPASTTFGIPDILALKSGYFIGIEIKREDGKGKSTLLQEQTVNSIINEGGLSAIVDNLDVVKRLIEALDTDYMEIENVWWTKIVRT